MKATFDVEILGIEALLQKEAEQYALTLLKEEVQQTLSRVIGTTVKKVSEDFEKEAWAKLTGYADGRYKSYTNEIPFLSKLVEKITDEVFQSILKDERLADLKTTIINNLNSEAGTALALPVLYEKLTEKTSEVMFLKNQTQNLSNDVKRLEQELKYEKSRQNRF